MCRDAFSSVSFLSVVENGEVGEKDGGESWVGFGLNEVNLDGRWRRIGRQAFVCSFVRSFVTMEILKEIGVGGSEKASLSPSLCRFSHILRYDIITLIVSKSYYYKTLLKRKKYFCKIKSLKNLPSESHSKFLQIN